MYFEDKEASLRDNMKELTDMNKTLEERVRDAEANSMDPILKRILEEKKTKPHLFNLHFDPQLNGRIVHILQKDEHTCGNGKKDSKGTADIVVPGPGYG